MTITYYHPFIKMTVVTRSQQNKMNNALFQERKQDIDIVQAVSNFKNKMEYQELKAELVLKMKEYSDKNVAAKKKEEKTLYVLKSYELVNRLLPKLIEKHPEQYVEFSAALFNKTTDLLIEINEGKWEGVDCVLVVKLREEMFKSRALVMPIIRYCDEPSNDPEVKKAMIYITTRNRRIDL